MIESLLMIAAGLVLLAIGLTDKRKPAPDAGWTVVIPAKDVLVVLIERRAK